MTVARKWVGFVLALVVLVGSVGIAPGAELFGNIWFASPSENRFTVTDRYGQNWIFAVDPQARIEVNTIPSYVSGLRTGDPVLVTYRIQGNVLIAYDVFVLRE